MSLSAGTPEGKMPPLNSMEKCFKCSLKRERKQAKKQMCLLENHLILLLLEKSDVGIDGAILSAVHCIELSHENLRPLQKDNL